MVALLHFVTMGSPANENPYSQFSYYSFAYSGVPPLPAEHIALLVPPAIASPLYLRVLYATLLGAKGD